VRLTSLLPLLPLTLLAACRGEPEATDAGGSATGEVLEGTISDEMLPLTTVTSQPPLLPPEEQDDDDADSPAARAATATPVRGQANVPAPEPTEQPPAPDDA
jgi:hypothetical protein